MVFGGRLPGSSRPGRRPDLDDPRRSSERVTSSRPHARVSPPGDALARKRSCRPSGDALDKERSFRDDAQSSFHAWRRIANRCPYILGNTPLHVRSPGIGPPPRNRRSGPAGGALTRWTGVGDGVPLARGRSLSTRARDPALCGALARTRGVAERSGTALRGTASAWRSRGATSARARIPQPSATVREL